MKSILKTKIFALVTLGFGMLGMSQIASANLITNGGFETGNFSGWSTSGLTCTGVGANYSSATGCVGYNGDPGPHSGSKAAYLGTAAGGGVISQLLATTIGQSYVVDFYLAIGSYNGASSPNSFVLNVGGNTLLSLTNAAAQGFAHYSYIFQATSSATSVAFTHGNAPSFFILDDVSVAVPEPAGLLLMSLGMVAFGFFRRRK